MKKALIVLLIFLVLPLCGCSLLYGVLNGYRVSYDDQLEKQPARIFEGKGSVKDFDVEILEAKKAETFDGKDAVVITYRWTNNSDDTAIFMDALDTCVFQDGIQLDSSIANDDSESYLEDNMRKVRPGKTLDVSLAYELRSDSPEIEVEVSDFLFEPSIIVKKLFTLE